MPERYFIKFPTIVYSNSTCVDITKRPVLSDKLTQNPSVFEKYTIKYNTRPDIVAENFYDDPMYDWLVYLNNGIVDPYYGWVLDDYEFEQHIIKKYGSIENAQKRIYLYRLNWSDTDVEITPSYYNTNLPDALKRYYTPRFGQDDKIVSYIRKADNTTTNTNKLIQFSVSFNNGNTFYVNEIVDIRDSTGTNVIGGGEVTFANSTTVILKHISGNTSASVQTNFNANTGVDNTTEYITTQTNHGLSNGNIVLYTVAPGNTALSGLSNGSYYYVRYANNTALKLSSTLTGSIINITASSTSETGHTLVSRNRIYGETSNASANISSSTILQENITDETAVYWSPVYYYEYENELNQSTKHIRLLRQNYALEAAEELRTVLKE